MKIFDTYIPIHDFKNSKIEIDHLHLEMLSKMLISHGIAHSYILPKSEEMEQDPTLLCYLCLEKKDFVPLSLIVGLWLIDIEACSQEVVAEKIGIALTNSVMLPSEFNNHNIEQQEEDELENSSPVY